MLDSQSAISIYLDVGFYYPVPSWGVPFFVRILFNRDFMVHGRWAVPFLSRSMVQVALICAKNDPIKSQTSPLIFSTLPPTIMEVEKNGIYISSISFPSLKGHLFHKTMIARSEHPVILTPPRCTKARVTQVSHTKKPHSPVLFGWAECLPSQEINFWSLLFGVDLKEQKGRSTPVKSNIWHRYHQNDAMFEAGNTFS